MTLPWMAAKIVLRPVGDLRPHAGNARLHSAEQLEQIKASMRAFGFTNPLLVDEADEVIAGHGRLEAATALGIAKVPVIVLRHLTSAQKDALRLADNRIAENATWDQALLRDALVAKTAKTHLTRLQPSVHRAALIDEQFFVSDEHPVRRLLNRLAQVRDGKGSAFQQRNERIGELVTQANRQFHDDVGVFEPLVGELESLLDAARLRAECVRLRISNVTILPAPLQRTSARLVGLSLPESRKVRLRRLSPKAVARDEEVTIPLEAAPARAVAALTALLRELVPPEDAAAPGQADGSDAGSINAS